MTIKTRNKNALSSTYTTAASTRKTFLIAFEQLQLLSNKATLTDFDFDRNFESALCEIQSRYAETGYIFSKTRYAHSRYVKSPYAGTPCIVDKEPTEIFSCPISVLFSIHNL